MLWVMLPCFPAGTRDWETGSRRKGKQGKEEILKGKCNHWDSGLGVNDGRAGLSFGG